MRLTDYDAGYAAGLKHAERALEVAHNQRDSWMAEANKHSQRRADAERALAEVRESADKFYAEMAKDYIANETADLRTQLVQTEQERDEYRRLWGILAEQNPRLIAKVNAAEQRVRALEGAERLIACQKDGILTLKERLAQAKQYVRALEKWRASVWKTPSPRDNSVLRRLDIQCNITVTEE